MEDRNEPNKIPRPPDNWYRTNPQPPETSQLNSKVKTIETINLEQNI